MYKKCILIGFVITAGLEKNGKSGTSLQGNFVIWREINKEIHKKCWEMLSYWREIFSIWREILLSLQGNKHFFQAWAGYTASLQ